MAQYLISESYLTNIADAIRGKLNVTTLYTPGEMSGAISSIPVATAPALQAKTVAPQEYQQIINADSPNVGLSSVTISAISKTYVGSDIDRQNSADLLVDGPTITAPAGYYERDASTSVVIMTLPTSVSTTSSGVSKLTIMPTTSNKYINIPVGYNNAASYYTINGDANLLAANIKSGVSIFGVTGSYVASGGLDTSDATAIAANILEDKTAYVKGVKITGSMVNNGATGGTITTQGGTYTIPEGYTSGGTVTASLTASTLTNSIISGSAYAEATGDYAWRSTVQIPAGYHNATTLTKDFSSIFPAPDTPATDSQILLNYQAYDKDGKLITGTMTNNSIGTITLDQTTTSYTIPAGYHDGTGKVQHTTVNIPDPTITVSSSGLITASGSWTRGFTTDNSYSKTQQLTTKAATTYTPGTTNQTIASGIYLTGIQTISGDANLISSNIISGVSIFGVNGNVMINKYYTGTSAPSSSLGSNGDIYLQE